MWAKVRAGEVTQQAAEAALGAFEADYAGEPPVDLDLVVSVVRESTIEVATLLIKKHGLRGYDGLQLAAAIEVRNLEPKVDQFASADAKLKGAAKAEGFRLYLA